MRQGGLVSALALVLLAAIAPAAMAERRTAGQLESRLGPGVEVRKQSETGAVGFVGTQPGRPIPARGDGPRRRALGLVREIAPEVGLRDPGRELEPAGLTRFADGRRSVRFRQVHEGVPVIGGELVVNLDPAGDVLSLSGETEPRLDLDTEPAVGAAEADDAAIAAVAREHGLDPASLNAGEGDLSIYDSRLLGGPGLGLPQLVWRFEVTTTERPDIRQLVLVEAERGAVVLSFNQVHAVLDREVCDAANTTTQVPCTAPVRSEGEGEVADSAGLTPGDVNAAYDFAGDTYDFYDVEHGRDSLDDAGMTLVSTADYCSSLDDCPMANAFWDGSQMAFGDGFAGADDVVGHELTHGVTEFSSNLFYYFQSGAINESFSDIWGELVDLGNGVGDDNAASRWLIGEDLPMGALRDMADPPAFGDPDRMTAANYTADPGEGDNGGVHTNSGVGNKAAYLMVDGDTFNGHTVSPLGVSKTADVFYEVQTNLLTSAADYLDLYNALNQACTNLIGTGGITAGDCAEVRDATEAVEMNVDPPQAPTVTAPTCEVGGETPMSTFFDDFEDFAPGRYAKLVVTGSDLWSYPASVEYATSGDGLIDAFDAPEQHDSSIAMSEAVPVPAGGLVRFDHAFGFEDNPTFTYDGGVVEYSTNGGASWSDLGPLFIDGSGYNGAIDAEPGFPNPLDGRPAFVRESNGYGASRADLSSLAGQSVRLRFRVGTDTFPDTFDQGWFIDDLRIYGCAPQTTFGSGPANGARTSDPTPSYAVSNSSAAGSGFSCSADGGPASACATTTATSATVRFGPLADGEHTLRVAALGSRGTPDPSPLVRTITVDTRITDPLLLARKRQRGRKVKVKARAGAGEAVALLGRGRVKLGSRKLKRQLKPVRRLAEAGERKRLVLKPKRRRDARRIRRALARGKKVRVIVVVVYTDDLGNTDRRRKVVRLR